VARAQSGLLMTRKSQMYSELMETRNLYSTVGPKEEKRKRGNCFTLPEEGIKYNSLRPLLLKTVIERIEKRGSLLQNSQNYQTMIPAV
jgi:hypothetical protein